MRPPPVTLSVLPLTMRTWTTLSSTALVLFCTAQQPGVEQGKPFSRTFKNTLGDQHSVVDGVLPTDGRPLLYVEEGPAHKVVRLDAQLQPTEEVVLKDVLMDGVKWNGVTPIIQDGTMRCLLVSSTKKSTDFGVGSISTTGALALTGFRKIASFDHAYTVDAATSLGRRPQPDPILFSLGLTSAHQERLVRSPDGQHYLLNMYSHGGKDPKRIWCVYMDAQLNEVWSTTLEFPFADDRSRVHQISLADNGNVHILSYVFRCDGQEKMGDKMCHEIHLSTIIDQGKTLKNVLVDKDFVSSARICERNDGRVTLALRYGALTGIPGQVLTFDPLDARLKTTPLVDQRLASIRKVKLTGFGTIDGDPNKPASVRAKLPDEVVAVLPAWDGGTVLIETFLENDFQLPVGDAVAIRHFCGATRASYIDASDTIRWQRTVDRAYLTTAGQAYETVGFNLHGTGIDLLFGHTPRGLVGILASGGEGEGKGPIPEPGVLKAVRLDRQGEVTKEGTALKQEKDLAASPMTAVFGSDATHVLVKSFDRGTTYNYAIIDLSQFGLQE